MKPYVALGLTAVAAVALFEVALVPALAVGGAAVLAPKYLPGLRRRAARVLNSTIVRRAEPAAGSAKRPNTANAQAVLPKLSIGQAIAKTITFRVIVTTLDFTTNYLVIGEVTTAAGLSTFNLVAGPLFYLSHEAVWNYLDPTEAADPSSPAAEARATGRRGYGGLPISRALAKTITFRAIATVMDFTVNYVVVRDVASAAVLSASGFFLGPFVYYGHEKLWDYFTARRPDGVALPSPTRLLPAPR